jgi:hypothetical protein
VDPDRAVDGWSVLADDTRRAIVTRLAEGLLAVGRLADVQNDGQMTVRRSWSLSDGQQLVL